METVKIRRNVILSILSVVLIIFVISFISGYNSIVNMEENIDSCYSEVENRLLQRHDKIGQLVETVEGMQEHIQEIYDMITSARAAYASAKTIDELIQADNFESQALSSFLVEVEDNPDITAISGYYALMDEIAATENTLAVARRDYNKSVRVYNSSVKKFPKVLIRDIFNFQKEYEYWKLNGGQQEVPEVDFS